MAQPDGLDAGEALVVTVPVSFAGSAAVTMRGAFSLRASQLRRAAVDEWARAAEHCGFPFASGDLIVGISDHGRIHVWRPRFFVARPGRHRGWFPARRVEQVGVVRRGAVTRLTLLIDDGTLIGFEAMRARRVRAFADAVRAAGTLR